MADKNLHIKIDGKADLSKAVKELKRLDKSTQKAKSGVSDLSNSFVGFGTAIGAFTLLKKAGKSVADFNQKITDLKSISNLTKNELRELALEAGENTSFSASKAAGALENFIQAGVNTKEALRGALIPSLDLAKVANIELSEATSIVTATVSASGLEFEQSADVVNIMTAAMLSGKTSVSEMGFAFQEALPILASLGVGLEDTSALVSTLGTLGVNGSKAGTALKNSFARLASGTAEVTKILEKHNITQEQVNESITDPIKLFNLLAPAVENTADATKLLGLEAITMIPIIENANETLGKTKKAMEGQAKATEITKERVETFSGAVTMINSKLETFLLSQKWITEALRVLGQSLLNLVTWFTSLDERILKAIAIAGTLVATFLVVFGSVVGLTGVLSILTAGIGAASLGFIALWSAMGVGIVVALGLAIYKLNKRFNVLNIAIDVVKNLFKVLWEIVKLFVLSVLKLYESFLKVTGILNLFKIALKEIKNLFSDLKKEGGKLKDFFKDLGKAISEFVIENLNHVKDGILKIIGIASKLPIVGKAFKNIGEAIKDIGNSIKDNTKEQKKNTEETVEGEKNKKDAIQGTNKEVKKQSNIYSKDLKTAVLEFFDLKKDEEKKDKDRLKENISLTLSGMKQGVNALANLFKSYAQEIQNASAIEQQAYADRIEEIEAENELSDEVLAMQEENKQIAFEEEQERLQEELAQAISDGDIEAQNKIENEIAIGSAEEEQRKKKIKQDKEIMKVQYEADVAKADSDFKIAKANREAAIITKIGNIANTISLAAASVVKPLAMLGPAGIPFSIANGITGGLQIAAAFASPTPPKPKLEKIKKPKGLALGGEVEAGEVFHGAEQLGSGNYGELFVPKQSGIVIPNSKIDYAMDRANNSSVVNNNNIQIDATGMEAQDLADELSRRFGGSNVVGL